jgi:hypothetical protein
LDLFK